MANSIFRLLLIASVYLPLSCKSNSAAAEVPCTCGTPTADIEGCAHASCLAGRTNPENPDCVCGTLSIPE